METKSTTVVFLKSIRARVAGTRHLCGTGSTKPLRASRSRLSSHPELGHLVKCSGDTSWRGLPRTCSRTGLLQLHSRRGQAQPHKGAVQQMYLQRSRPWHWVCLKLGLLLHLAQCTVRPAVMSCHLSPFAAQSAGSAAAQPMLRSRCVSAPAHPRTFSQNNGAVTTSIRSACALGMSTRRKAGRSIISSETVRAASRHCAAGTMLGTACDLGQSLHKCAGADCASSARCLPDSCSSVL